jgi:hypothetical protein
MTASPARDRVLDPRNAAIPGGGLTGVLVASLPQTESQIAVSISGTVTWPATTRAP